MPLAFHWNTPSRARVWLWVSLIVLQIGAKSIMHARSQSTINQSISTFFNWHFFRQTVHTLTLVYTTFLHRHFLLPLVRWPSWRGSCVYSIVSVAWVAKSFLCALRVNKEAGSRLGGPQRRFIRGGSAPRCNPFFFYIAFWLKNGIPFTYLF